MKSFLAILCNNFWHESMRLISLVALILASIPIWHMLAHEYDRANDAALVISVIFDLIIAGIVGTNLRLLSVQSFAFVAPNYHKLSVYVASTILMLMFLFNSFVIGYSAIFSLWVLTALILSITLGLSFSFYPLVIPADICFIVVLLLFVIFKEDIIPIVNMFYWPLQGLAVLLIFVSILCVLNLLKRLLKQEEYAPHNLPDILKMYLGLPAQQFSPEDVVLQFGTKRRFVQSIVAKQQAYQQRLIKQNSSVGNEPALLRYCLFMRYQYELIFSLLWMFVLLIAVSWIVSYYGAQFKGGFTLFGFFSYIICGTYTTTALIQSRFDLNRLWLLSVSTSRAEFFESVAKAYITVITKFFIVITVLLFIGAPLLSLNNTDLVWEFVPRFTWAGLIMLLVNIALALSISQLKRISPFTLNIAVIVLHIAVFLLAINWFSSLSVTMLLVLIAVALILAQIAKYIWVHIQTEFA